MYVQYRIYNNCAMSMQDRWFIVRVVLLPSPLVPVRPGVGGLERGSGWGEGGEVWRGEQVEGEDRDRTCGEEGEGHLEECV